MRIMVSKHRASFARMTNDRRELSLRYTKEIGRVYLVPESQKKYEYWIEWERSAYSTRHFSSFFLMSSFYCLAGQVK